MIEDLINIWQTIVNNINNDSLICSTEKAICFQFAWQVKQMFNDSNIDFERRLFENDFSDGMFLDLLIEHQAFRVGIEFKFMKSDNSHNTNQTVTRVKIINDLKRLTYLKINNKITDGLFLCLTNEMPYTYKGKKTINWEFKTYHNEIYCANEFFPIHDTYSIKEIRCLDDIRFCWNGITENGSRYKLDEQSKYAWLTPIII